MTKFRLNVNDMESKALSPRPVPVFHDENVCYSTKKLTMSLKKPETKPPKLEIKNKTRCVLFPSVNNTAKAVSFNNDSNLSQLYDECLRESYFEQCFENLKKLGEGSFGEVYKVRFKEDDLLYAVKKTRRGRLNEVRRYELVPPHPHCIRLYKAWEQNDYLYMQMELCDDNLDRYASVNHEIPENRVWDILLDLVLGLQNLHKNNLLHLDIKPANILLSSTGTCKLGDFGLLFDLVHGNINEAVEGDSKYMAPELMNGNFTKAADIFSLGITILEVSCDLELPTNGPLWHQLRCGMLPSHCSAVISEELLDLIRMMTSQDPTLRPSVETLLRHQKLRFLMSKRKSSLSLMQTVRHTMSDWIFRKILSITSGLCISLTKIYERAFISTKKQNSSKNYESMHSSRNISSRFLNSPIKKIKRLSREPMNLLSSDIFRIHVRRPTTEDFVSIEDTPPRLPRQFHSTPLMGFSAKKLFNAFDSEEDDFQDISET